MADLKKTFGYALLQAFGLDDQRVKRLRLDIEAGDVPLLTVTVYPRDVSAQQIEAIATEYEIISRSELRDIRERLAAPQQAEPVTNKPRLPLPGQVAALKAQRDELLEALDRYRGQLDRFGGHSATDAIDAVKGGSKWHT